MTDSENIIATTSKQLETWKSIPDLPGYEASDMGRIRSLPKENWPEVRVLKQKLRNVKHNRVHYLVIEFRVNRRSVYRFIHRCVLEAFVGPCPSGMECCHANGNPLDNRLENLRWDTRRNNIQDAMNAGRIPKGESHYGRKFTEDQIQAIRAQANNGVVHRRLAEEFNVCHQAISDIVLRRNWKHIP